MRIEINPPKAYSPLVVDTLDHDVVINNMQEKCVRVVSDNNESLYVQLRTAGFMFYYSGKWYVAANGVVELSDEQPGEPK